jgi:transcriptional regulator with XRE-family HTH domain
MLIMDRKKFTEDVGKSLERAYSESEIKSQTQLSSIAKELGYDVSPDAIAKYFAGGTEPGIYAITGLAKALKKTIDSFTPGDSTEILDEKVKAFVSKVSNRLREASTESNIDSPNELAVIANNIGFRISTEDIVKYLDGKKEPGIYEFTGLLKALGRSSDLVLFDKDPVAEAELKIQDAANRLAGFIDDAKSKETPDIKKLRKLYLTVPEKVQKAVMQILENAAQEEK